MSGACLLLSVGALWPNNYTDRTESTEIHYIHWLMRRGALSPPER